MTDQLISVLVGAIVASIVPVYTLIKSTEKWKIEKRADLLKVKYDRVEKIYGECLAKLGKVYQEEEIDSDTTSSLLVFGSTKAINAFDEYVNAAVKDAASAKIAYFKMAIAAKEHLAEIAGQIESAFK